ncbi:MAG: hypothetical protein QOJ70_2728 [Acidobacteriota bacterium]|jgi:uncharacterized protein (DUF58 family)|nr:hypothetical protein [Acidobacteriota bacterium]
MRFIFTKLFYALMAFGFVPLSLSWGRPGLRWLALVFDAGLLAAALLDARASRLPEGLEIFREFGGRFYIGAETEVRVRVNNHTPRAFSLKLKDEYPPEMMLVAPREVELNVAPHESQTFTYVLKPVGRGRFEFGRVAVRVRSRLGLVWREERVGETVAVKVYPNVRRAREAELKALGARSLVAAQRRAAWRGEGRDFESLRDYVYGDELRHVSWSATARRGRLTTRQYQIERDQTVIIALDAGRLMTARIERETKFDTAVHAALALMSAAQRVGDHAGLVVFGRRVRVYVPPAKGREQLDAVLEALHAIEPELIEPSYTRAFEFIAANCKRRSFVVLLTDLVDEEGSRELLKSLRILRPRHLPLVTTIADRDLRASVRDAPATLPDLFTQSVAEEIMLQRESALRLVEAQGGLALDVTTGALVPSLLETYIRVKERGLL